MIIYQRCDKTILDFEGDEIVCQGMNGDMCELLGLFHVDEIKNVKFSFDPTPSENIEILITRKVKK